MDILNGVLKKKVGGETTRTTVYIPTTVDDIIKAALPDVFSLSLSLSLACLPTPPFRTVTA